MFEGDLEFSVDATGDVVVGDDVRFERAVFVGSYRRPRFLGYDLITAKVTKESYGSQKQQHTFTLEMADGSKTLIKGRNLYRHGVWRKPWANEADRALATTEKHARGEEARKDRAERRQEESYGY